MPFVYQPPPVLSFSTLCLTLIPAFVFAVFIDLRLSGSLRNCLPSRSPSSLFVCRDRLLRRCASKTSPQILNLLNLHPFWSCANLRGTVTPDCFLGSPHSARLSPLGSSTALRCPGPRDLTTCTHFLPSLRSCRVLVHLHHFSQILFDAPQMFLYKYTVD